MLATSGHQPATQDTVQAPFSLYTHKPQVFTHKRMPERHNDRHMTLLTGIRCNREQLQRHRVASGSSHGRGHLCTRCLASPAPRRVSSIRSLTYCTYCSTYCDILQSILHILQNILHILQCILHILQRTSAPYCTAHTAKHT